MTDTIDSSMPEDDGEDGNGDSNSNGSGNDSGDVNGDGKAWRKGAGEEPGYEVGYCKPPEQHRFRKGQSGNPRGPKKGAKGIKKDLHKALRARHSIRVDGKIMTGTTQELALLTLAKRAATGDVRATRELVELTIRVFGIEDRGRDRDALSAHDRELFRRVRERAGENWPDGEETADAAGSLGAPDGPDDAGGSEDDRESGGVDHQGKES
jgi:hypothetical protein